MFIEVKKWNVFIRWSFRSIENSSKAIIAKYSKKNIIKVLSVKDLGCKYDHSGKVVHLEKIQVVP